MGSEEEERDAYVSELVYIHSKVRSILALDSVACS